MTRDDIIRMAQEASILGSFDMLQGNQWRQDTIRGLERFAFLVAAAERERNAQIADAHASVEGIAQLIAAEIRSQQ